MKNTNSKDFNAIIEYSRTVRNTMNEAAMSHIGPQPKPIALDEYKARQHRLTSQLRPNDVLIVCAAEESTHSNDVHYPYRTMSEMLYFVAGLSLRRFLYFAVSKALGSQHSLYNRKTHLRKFGKVAGQVLKGRSSIGQLMNRIRSTR